MEQANKREQPIDPLRRVRIPIERRQLDGTYVLETTDKQQYVRYQDGSIRRERPKINGKLARKLRAQARRKG